MFRHTRSIGVFLWGKHVGDVIPSRTHRNTYAFIYDLAFIEGGVQIAPLEMPLADRVYEFPGFPQKAFYGLPPAIADSLPDSFGNSLIDRWLAQEGVEKGEITALDRLAYTGTRGPGALTFRPNRLLGKVHESAVVMRDLVEQARRVANHKIEEFGVQCQLNEIIRLGSSLGGAQAKAVVGWNREEDSFRYGTLDLPPEFEQWIFKFTPLEHPNRGRIEFEMYERARACGIDMMESRLYELDGLSHFMTRRFDREDGSRQHILTFAAMCHLFPGLSGGAVASYEQLFMAIERLGMAYEDKEQMFRRMVFNVLVDECDDHVKNFAFRLREGGRWELAPAYDLTGTPASCEDDVWGNFAKIHAMSINGKQQGITDDDMIKVGDRFGIGNAQAITAELRDVLKRKPTI